MFLAVSVFRRRRRDSWCGGTPVDLSEVLLDPTPESVDGELELDNWNIGLRFLSS